MSHDTARPQTRSTATLTTYNTFPGGLTFWETFPVEVVAFEHDRHGISRAQICTETGGTWWVPQCEMSDIEVQVVAA